MEKQKKSGENRKNLEKSGKNKKNLGKSGENKKNQKKSGENRKNLGKSGTRVGPRMGLDISFFCHNTRGLRFEFPNRFS
jgi:hypothetical protein